MAIESPTQIKTVGQLFDMQDELDFNLAIQRQEDLWTQEAKSLLVHSALYGFPIPPIWNVDKNDGKFVILDGKQRVKSGIFNFIQNKYVLKLDEEYATIEDEVINGKTFRQLSEKLQKRLLNASVMIIFLKNITDEETEEFFKRLNGGLSLSQIEISRVMASSSIMSFVQEIASNKFFSETIALTETNRKRFIDEELILQILSLIVNEDPIALSGSEIRSFAKQLRHTGISEKHQEIMRETTEYLNLAIPDKNKDLKKVHVPMIFLMAIQAQQIEKSPQRFGGWVQKFFDKKTYKTSLYKTEYASSKTASLQNVAGRIKEMQDFFDEHIETVGDYVKPVAGQRGRKPKETIQTAIDTTNKFVADVEHVTLNPINQLDDSNSKEKDSGEKWEEFKQEFPNADSEKLA